MLGKQWVSKWHRRFRKFMPTVLYLLLLVRYLFDYLPLRRDVQHQRIVLYRGGAIYGLDHRSLRVGGCQAAPPSILQSYPRSHNTELNTIPFSAVHDMRQALHVVPCWADPHWLCRKLRTRHLRHATSRALPLV